MRAGRLAEIFSNEEIVIVGASGNKAHTKEYRSEWNLYDFVHRFPNTEIVKLTPIANNKLMVLVYDATAKALAEKRYDDVQKYSELLESHVFSDDVEYIQGLQTILQVN
jgi:hypothetical protein